jgi:hypothetical protein
MDDIAAILAEFAPALKFLLIILSSGEKAGWLWSEILARRRCYKFAGTCSGLRMQLKVLPHVQGSSVRAAPAIESFGILGSEI